MEKCGFSTSVASKLGHYVYLLIDPFDSRVFYVGKGKGNRCFGHFTEEKEKDKNKKIKEIQKAGKEPVIEILAHNLPDEETAFKVEAAVIDVIGKKNLTNQVRGKGSILYGRMGLDEIISHYEKKKVEITHPVILIRINKLYRYDMSPIELYDATRGFWVVGKKNREQAKYALAVFEGIVVEVYEIVQWFPAKTTFNTRPEKEDAFEGAEDFYEEIDSPARWEFVGRIADDDIRDKYRKKSVEDYFSNHSQNPIKYEGFVSRKQPKS